MKIDQNMFEVGLKGKDSSFLTEQKQSFPNFFSSEVKPAQVLWGSIRTSCWEEQNPWQKSLSQTSRISPLPERSFFCNGPFEDGIDHFVSVIDRFFTEKRPSL